MASSVAAEPRVLNVNVGILGHVDSGKTSLARALSTTLSTAALDKNPQSQERGITLDLGFSAFSAPVPAHLQAAADAAGGYDRVQFTLVDCPGHASLIRTIIGGAQIIDMMLLVIDINKGIQTQTAECLVIGELLTDRLVVVLNKIDLLPEAERASKIALVQKKLAGVFAGTRFGATVPMIPVAACVGAAVSLNVAASAASADALAVPAGSAASGGSAAVFQVQPLVDHLLATLVLPTRNLLQAPLRFAVDHCFPIKGHGTVLTGTVLAGTVAVKDTVEISALGETRKVKSMQMFHRPVQVARQGDRVGMCVTQLPADAVERGLVVAPGSVAVIAGCLARVDKIRFFKGRVRTGAKFHFTTGHHTVMGSVHFFRAGASGLTTAMAALALAAPPFDWTQEYEHSDELLTPTELAQLLAKQASATLPEEPDQDDELDPDGAPAQAAAAAAAAAAPAAPAAGSRTAAPVSAAAVAAAAAIPQYALIRFDTPLRCPAQSMLIASKLDTDIRTWWICGRIMRPSRNSDFFSLPPQLTNVPPHRLIGRCCPVFFLWFGVTCPSGRLEFLSPGLSRPDARSS